MERISPYAAAWAGNPLFAPKGVLADLLQLLPSSGCALRATLDEAGLSQLARCLWNLFPYPQG